MKQRVVFCAIAILFTGAIFIVAKGFLRNKADTDVPVKSMSTWQQAGAPLGYPLREGASTISEFDPRFIQLDAFERVTLPTISATSAPMGSENGALTYNAQVFWANNPKRGGHHTGDDFNGIGGMNTDLGDPLYAIANGRVIYRGEPSPGWGNTLILAHRTPEGSTLLTMYAHMDQMHVALGSTIPMGQIIGTVGNAHSRYPAHLHLEIHDSTGIHIGAGYTSKPGDRIDPSHIIAQYQNARLSPSIFNLVLIDQQKNKQGTMTIKNSMN